jgi:predicted nucleic acid-binding protein
MPNRVLLDNTVLSNLAIVGQMDLVFHLWPDQAATTRAVLREYAAAAERGLLPRDAWRYLPVVEMTREESSLVLELSPRLGAGERSCIAVVHTRGGHFVSDDADARRAAQSLGVSVSGTLGVLVLAVRRDLLTLAQANILLADMIAAGYRSPLERLDRLL